MKHQINITVNGDLHTVLINSWDTLNQILREKLNLTGTKFGCGAGDCGACTVILDGKSVSSCLTLGAGIDGSKILTVEGLTELKSAIHPIQENFINKGAIQCGFCTPGMEMSALALLQENKNPTKKEIKEAISGNLCRCTGYNKIIEAIYETSKTIKKTI